MASLATITAVKSRLAASGITTPINHPNSDFTPPADPVRWIAVQYPVATERQASFGAPGSNVFREEGAIRFVINEPVTAGIEGAAAEADILRALFRNARFAGVRTYAPTSPVFDDRVIEGNYCRVSLAVPYDLDIHA